MNSVGTERVSLAESSNDLIRDEILFASRAMSHSYKHNEEFQA